MIIARYFFSLLIALAASMPVFAQSVQARIGEATVTLPIPAGFADPAVVAPGLYKYMEATIPPASRQLAVFVSEDDMAKLKAGEEPALTRYFAAQTVKVAESMHFERSHIEVTKGQIRNEQAALMKNINAATAALANDTAERVKAHLNEPSLSSLSLKIGEIMPMGVFNETDNAISLAMLTKISASNAGVSVEVPLVMVVNYVFFKGKIVFFFVYSRYDSPADLEWAKSVSLQWYADALKVN